MLPFPALIAEDLDVSGWQSLAHFGFAVHEASESGFKGASGSLLFLDVLRKIDQDLVVGLRTASLGSKIEGHSLYRLGVGPAIFWQVDADILLGLNINIFKEVTETKSEERLYKSVGYESTVSLLRQYQIYEKVHFAVGGFWAYYRGGLDLHSAIEPRPQRFQNLDTNRGSYRGIEISLRTSL